MALIKCAECGKDISDKSFVCINCGYPISGQQPKDIDIYFERIYKLIENYFREDTKSEKKFDSLFGEIKVQINRIKEIATLKQDEEKIEIFNRVALIILDFTWKCSDYCGWITYKEYFELIDFQNVSSDIIDIIGENIYNRLIKIEYHNDGSSGNNEHIMLWYPIYIVLKFGSKEIVEHLLGNLNEVDCFGQARLKTIQSMVREHLGKELYLDTADIIVVEDKSLEESLNRAKRNQLQIINNIENQKKQEMKTKTGLLIVAVILTFLAISLWGGFLSLLIGFGATFLYAMLFVTNGSVSRMEEDLELAKLDIRKYEEQMKLRTNALIRESESRNEIEHPKCPHCGSRQTYRISTTSRVISVGVVGIASDKIGKQFGCKKCKYKW